MSARRKRRRATPARRKTSTRRQPSEPILTPEVRAAILAVALTVTGAVLCLSLFGLAGPLGRALVYWCSQAIGWATWVVAPLILATGVQLLRNQPPSRRTLLGSTIMLLAFTGVLHVVVKTEALETAARGEFGGLVGYGLSSTLSYALNDLGSMLVLIGLFTAGAFITFGLNRAEQDSAAEQPAARPKVQRPPAPPPEPESASKARRAAEDDTFTPRVVDTAWEQPPLSLLSRQSTQAQPGDTKRASQIIESTLAHFNIQGEVVAVNVGPTVTQYELKPAVGMKLTAITALTNDLALALAAHPIRIEAPIPGKSSVGIEVPNHQAATVRLHSLFSDSQWQRGGALPLALGLDVSGEAVVADLATMPHLLIAGATGSGKSIGINTILMSLLYTHSPKHLRLLLVDPKRVELTMFNDIPHLIAPVITDAPKVVNALKWVVTEMDRRYKLFQDEGVKNLIEYNQKYKDDELAYLVVVIDELADLMMVSGKSVEAAVVRIAQLARATGIHLILATQRPSVDVITGLIKANFPSRMAFTVSSSVDSRTILDAIGAEKLLGKGDMLFLPGNVAKPMRVQGAFADTAEVKRLTDFLKGKGAPSYDESITESSGPQGVGGQIGGDGGEDALYEQAKNEVLRARKASASFLQRRLQVGYARAARILDELEENGIIGPGEGAKPRAILVDEEPLE